MFRNFFWMGLSSGVRLGTGLVLFILIARHLGPKEFGHYMFWYGTAALCSLLPNYGLANMLLKEIAQHPENVTNTLSATLSLRFTLSSIIFLCAMVSSVMVDRPELLLALLLAHLVEIISETLYVGYRALGHYDRESQLAACASILQFAFVIVAVITNQKTAVIALSHLAGKVAQLFLMLPISRRIFGTLSLQPIYKSFKLARRTKAYAIDNIFGSAFGNIDSIILRTFAGVDVVGIYQSGMRIFQGGNQVAPILGNVFLPEMAKQTLKKENNSRITLILQTSFLSYGLIFGLILAYFSDQIVDYAFGNNYNQLKTLLPLFGLLFYIRFFAAAWGVVLTATGYQGFRAKAALIHWIVALPLGSYLTNSLKAQGWIITLILTSLLLGVLFVHKTIRSNLGISVKLNVGMAIFGGMFFIPKFI